MPQALREAALRDDWAGWAAAWQRLDEAEVAEALAAAEAGEPVTLILCGERNAVRFEKSARSAWRRLTHGISSIFGAQPNQYPGMKL
ncbi:hypothetical protein [Xylophilus sp. ASV27]|uniref:hypothetical protein n=1 Tax=Xylophilus sp. ASV27 TaxID=2795129 RepID=UPI0018EBED05|nr:hypothetical protein [Xylophilus sp. ASV27]